MMIYFKNKYISLLISTIFCGLSLSSCIYDTLEVEDPYIPELEDTYSLTFQISLPTMGRAGSDDDIEGKEDYIDTSSLQVLFFYANEPDSSVGLQTKAEGEEADENDGGNEETETPTKEIFEEGTYDTLIRAFKASEGLKLIPMSSSSDGTTKWHIQIPIGDNVEDQEFADKLRNNDFKIAVLANWDATAAEYAWQTGESIDALHHMRTDDNYTDPVYSFLHKSGKIGGYKSFYDVKIKNIKDDNSVQWVRNNWNPSLDFNLPLDMSPSNPTEYQYKDNDIGTYSDLWFLWNFGGADNVPDDYEGKGVVTGVPSSLDINDNYEVDDIYNKPGYDSGTVEGSTTKSSNALKYSKWAGNWEVRNGRHLREWIKGSNPDKIPNYDPKVKLRSLKSHDIDDEDETNYLTYTEIEGGKAVWEETTQGSKVYRYGVRIPKINPGSKGVNLKTGGVFSFIARASGRLFVYAQGVEGSGTLSYQLGENSSKSDISIQKDPSYRPNANKGEKIDITGDEQRIYIYNSGSRDIIIYAIEYVQGPYVSATARRGRTTQSIPMYGVQTFKALGDHWIRGTIFDLSNTNNQIQSSNAQTPYQLSDIYLLRSVAKVELLIPKSLNPHHVYLRSANASVRCEPMDVSTNTKDLWKDNTNEAHKSKDCEFFEILGHIPFFSTSPSSNQIDSYQQKLAWYYGTWAEGYKKGDTNTNLTIGGVTVPAISFGKDRNNQTDYPHIMNPRILRSDFVEFVEDENYSDNIYRRFILYVGEKFVDDPNSITYKDANNNDQIVTNLEAQLPKVCHIEFRSNQDYKKVSNLDDNNCYRIYFTEGGFNSVDKTYPTFGKVPQTDDEGNQLYDDDNNPLYTSTDDNWEKTYEQDPDNLRKHWPIIRNHCYKFTVTEANARYVSVDVKVLAWAKRDITVTW